MPRKSACKKLNQNTLKQSNLSASIDVETYHPHTVIDSDVKIVDDDYLRQFYCIVVYIFSFYILMIAANRINLFPDFYP